jgi:Icc-related predicted phosphoesterase
VKIQIVSDLHLEFCDINIKNENNADVLVLAGDIMVASKVHKPESEYGIRFRDFLKRVSFQFPHVIYIMGNHEFYNSGRWVGGIEDMRQACAIHDNIYFLERNMKIIDDIVFVGGTLWTDMNKGDPLTLHAVRDMMNDYNAIRNDEKGYTNLKPADTAIRHRETRDYIKHIVKEHKDKKCVVVGHHAPSYQSVHEMYRNDYLMNGAYYSSLEDIMLDNENIKLWIHGHMHNTFDYTIGKTRVVCNPRGYHSMRGDGTFWGEDTGWNENFIVEV